MSIYRKYRPVSFRDLLHQELPARIIQDSARANKLSHAYLLSGPRGVGKTTTARLIAKLANCEERQKSQSFHAEGNPCNACLACSEIDENRSLDVFEIDAASNRGIDEIRNLKEGIRLAPSRLLNKIYIIDEVHMLTKEAFNALLKTLEEPPGYTIFILATTEAEKVPATIISRVQHFHFKRIPREGILNKLTWIAEAEEIEIEPDALDLIAASAEGGMRDAESLLEHFISFGEKKIKVADVERVLGRVGFKRVSDFCQLLLKRDISASLAFLAEINNEGHNLIELCKDLIQYLRRVAVLKFSPTMQTEMTKELMEEHVAVIMTHSLLWDDRTLQTLKNLIQAYSQMRYSQFAIIPLEIAIIESLK